MTKIIHPNEHRGKKKVKTDFENNFFKLMNNSVFGKTMEDVRKDRDIKLVTIEKKVATWYQNQTIIAQSFFTENLLAIEIRKIQILMNKPVYLILSVLELKK